ncbi:MAG: hypothetical protein R3E18_04095 [Sphingomonadaceae bacterium]|nr:hypothetical protein [Sphingomonadaceae bacterium]
MRARQTSLFSAFATLLIGAALLLRVAIPAGWMPDTGADGVMRVTLCTGYGKVAAWIDEDGTLHRGEPADDDGNDGKHCAFTATALSLATADMPDLPQPQAMPQDVPPASLRDLAPGQGLAAPPPPATGPPSLA